MICKNCGCKIKGEPHRCPLCDFVFSEEANKSKKKKGLGFYKNPFTLIYILADLALFFILYLIGDKLDWNKPVLIACLVSLIPIYLIIRHVLLGMRNQASKLTILSILVSLFLVTILEITSYTNGYYYIYTSFHASIFILTIVVVFCNFKVYYPYISGFPVQSLLSWIPFAICIARGQIYGYPLAVALAENLFSIIMICCFPKEMLNQLKRFFAV